MGTPEEPEMPQAPEAPEESDAGDAPDQEVSPPADHHRINNLRGEHRTREAIWACSCGKEMPYFSVLGHRRARKNSPECTGEMVFIREDPPAGAPPPAPPAEPEAEAAAPEPPGIPGWEYDEDEFGDAETDPEKVAERLLAEMYGHINGNGNGNGHGGPGAIPAGEGFPEEGEGEFAVEPPTQPINASQYKEIVYLPAIIRIYYDWARAHGWRQGDGSISAFVVDILQDHVKNCWGKAVVVIDRDEVKIV